MDSSQRRVYEEFRAKRFETKEIPKLMLYYPDTGPLRRELYVKHNQFFQGGANKRERLMLAANRVGKTEGVGGYEMALHLTGLYPEWWTGRRFTKPIQAWAAGDSAKTTRDIVQRKLYGPINSPGAGLIPADCIVDSSARAGVPDALDSLFVKHISGATSQLNFKSYEQGRKAFEGTEQDVIWLDEEPPLAVYTECLLRTMTSNGIIMLTFTPLMGMSETVMQFLEGGEIKEVDEGSKLVVMATWDDAPHLDEKSKAEMMLAIPAFQRDARSKGVPQLGAGAIYPVPESDVLVDDFPIPDHWPRVYGFDVGWNKTAAIFACINRETDTVYLYSEHYRGQAEPSLHAEGIKARGSWIPGVIDPASRGRAQKDGFQLLEAYKELGLDIETAFNGVESGIYEVWQRLSSGRLKVFKSCQSWLSEFRLYRRDEKGHIVKSNDHLMDATRYLVMSGLTRAITKPSNVVESEMVEYTDGSMSSNWLR